ncbi:DNA-directed RNA polymerase III subunit RPC5 [Patella vulgata]|uniref:DNA-directed RNA polymerase III subunit RPC5 n=1 Tax=Patella vulgata TaxID=6465 RepID=UPI0024A90CD8|nr:DNA-directed RNA polymerase III subunit RPC5 [Patella vulgata]
MADDDDPVVQEIDVFLSKSLSENLYLLQYPVRTCNLPYDDVEHLSTKVKTEQKKVEMELAMNTESSNYADSKGEQIALNVDGSNDGREAKVYTSDRMDKQVLRSTPQTSCTKRYAVGLLKDGEMHMTPLSAIVQMKPAFEYLDKADVREKNKIAALADGESSQDEAEDDAKPVTVKFARPENDITKARRLASYKYLNSHREKERWIPVQYHNKYADRSASERLSLIASKNDDISEFHLHGREYLHTLVPSEKSEENARPEMPSNVLSLSHLRTLPLPDQIKSLLINVKVIRFNQLLSLLDPGTDAVAVLRSLQHYALLVQGCWIVKSEILYPKDACSPESGVSSEYLCRGRDFIMWKFTHSRYVIRKDISSVIKLPAEDVKVLLEQMSSVKANKGWEFLFEYDTEFCDKYNEIVERQKMLWDARYQTLSKVFKIPKDADKKAKGAESTLITQATSDKPKRKKSSSSRKRTSSGRSASDVSDMETDTRHNSESDTTETANNCEPMEITENNHVTTNSNSPIKIKDTKCDNGLTSEKQLTLELISFVRDLLNTKKVFTISELRKRFDIKLSECSPGHVLFSGVTEQTLTDTIITSGGIQLNNQWPPKSKSEVIFAQVRAGDIFDEMRPHLLDLFNSSFRVKISTVKTHLQENIEDEITETTCKKLLKDYCVSRGGFWYLKETLPTES